MSTQAVGRTNAVTTDSSAAAVPGSDASLLAEPSSDPATAIMQLMVKLHQDEKKADRQEEQAAEKTMAAENDKRVQEMHAKADDIFAAGMVGCAMSAASAAVSIGSAQLSYDGATDKIEGNLKGGAGFERTAAVLGGAGKAWDGLAGLGQACFGAAEANHDANAAQHEGASKLAERHAGDARDRRKAADDDIRFVLDWFRKLQDTTNETTHQLSQRV